MPALQTEENTADKNLYELFTPDFHFFSFSLNRDNTAETGLGSIELLLPSAEQVAPQDKGIQLWVRYFLLFFFGNPSCFRFVPLFWLFFSISLQPIGDDAMFCRPSLWSGCAGMLWAQHLQMFTSGWCFLLLRWFPCFKWLMLGDIHPNSSPDS